MMVNKRNVLIYIGLFLFWSCSLDSQKAQAVGFVTHFTRQGVIWKSWEIELNSSQTGMTSTAQELHLSIDNDNEDHRLINALDSAQKHGWKVQIDYQQNFGANCAFNRGETSKFIKSIEVLDRTPLGGIKDGTEFKGRVIDTIYVVIDKSK